MKLRAWWIPVAVLVLIVLVLPLLAWGMMGTGSCVPWAGA